MRRRWLRRSTRWSTPPSPESFLAGAWQSSDGNASREWERSCAIASANEAIQCGAAVLDCFVASLLAMARSRLQLPNRIEIPGRVGGVFADAQRGVVDEMVRRHRQIVGRRHAAIDPAGGVVFGAVARTEIAADPVRHRRGLTGIRIEQRNAAEMRADAD